MTDKIYLLLRILGPKVDVEDIHCVLDFAGHDVSAMNPRDAIGGGGSLSYPPSLSVSLSKGGNSTYLQSISLPVTASVTIRRMHGGGVIGLRS